MPVRTLLLTIHILSIAAWFGGGLGGTFIRSRLVEKGGAIAAASVRVSQAMGTRFFTPAALLTLLSGIGLVLSSDGAYTFGSLFVIVGLSIFLVSAVGNSVFGGSRESRALEAFESGDDAAGKAAIDSVSGFSLVELVLLTATVVAMVYRWGA
ncbi:MAG: DUF2269 family protein [Acidimicrobiia bacterium]